MDRLKSWNLQRSWDSATFLPISQYKRNMEAQPQSTYSNPVNPSWRSTIQLRNQNCLSKAHRNIIALRNLIASSSSHHIVASRSKNKRRRWALSNCRSKSRTISRLSNWLVRRRISIPLNQIYQLLNPSSSQSILPPLTTNNQLQLSSLCQHRKFQDRKWDQVTSILETKATNLRNMNRGITQKIRKRKNQQKNHWWKRRRFRRRWSKSWIMHHRSWVLRHSQLSLTMWRLRVDIRTPWLYYHQSTRQKSHQLGITKVKNQPQLVRVPVIHLEYNISRVITAFGQGNTEDPHIAVTSSTWKKIRLLRKHLRVIILVTRSPSTP